MTRNTGYDEATFDVLMKYEDWHWWFQCRNTLIAGLLEKFSTTTDRILEIGCGNGLVTEEISKRFPESEITGTEYLEGGLTNARARLPGVTFKQLDARDLDGTDSYDVVCAFDVLEHIDADVDVMTSIRAAMRDESSRFYITVPQHMGLWSQADVYAMHERRYAFGEMRDKLATAGFAIEYRTSYVFLLAPLMFLSRRFKGNDPNWDFESEFKVSRASNTVLSLICKTEAMLRTIGLPMPFGGSLVVVAKPV